MHIVRVVVFGAIAAAVSLGVGAQAPTFASHPAAKTKTVKVIESHNKYMFSPAKITVKLGTKVIWKNTTDAAHTVTGQGSWSSFNKPLGSGHLAHSHFRNSESSARSFA
jgi:plastocyanin